MPAACIETTFNGPPYSGFPQFCAPDQLAGDLKSVGLDLLSTASNHSLDTWFSGLTRTLDVLDEAGLRTMWAPTARRRSATR